MLRLHSLVALTVATFAVAALVGSALVSNLASARTASHFRALSPITASTAPTVGEVWTQRQFAEAQQLGPTIAKR
ncbi:MAG: hypothetical protein K2Z80_34720 [Xanthobacteraceae bacterium]|nr:hypothetical protein [Xanthobacteraceae bacterium]